MLAFVNCFGIASFSAVLTELYYPTAPPWYYEENGTAPADYSMHVCSFLHHYSFHFLFNVY